MKRLLLLVALCVMTQGQSKLTPATYGQQLKEGQVVTRESAELLYATIRTKAYMPPIDPDVGLFHHEGDCRLEEEHMTVVKAGHLFDVNCHDYLVAIWLNPSTWEHLHYGRLSDREFAELKTEMRRVLIPRRQVKYTNMGDVQLIRIKNAHAQSPKPTEFKLNPDASKVWASIDQAEADLQRQYNQLEAQRATLLIGAGVPQDSRSCKADDKGIVICSKPETAKTERK